MTSNSDRISVMLARARKFSRQEQLEKYQEFNARYGMVAGLRTTKEGFASYLKRREADDRRRKHGL